MKRCWFDCQFEELFSLFVLTGLSGYSIRIFGVEVDVGSCFKVKVPTTAASSVYLSAIPAVDGIDPYCAYFQNIYPLEIVSKNTLWWMLFHLP